MIHALLGFARKKRQVQVIFVSIFLLFFIWAESFSQQLRFDHVLGNESDGDPFLSIAQDKYGFMWFTRHVKGLQRYDGKELISYLHNPLNSNSLANNRTECMVIDSENMIWIGTYGSGLDRFDPSTKKFTHYRHNDQDISSLSRDSITALLADRAGNLWVGSHGGLDLLDKKTGKFTHFVNRESDPESLSYNEVRVIYEDRTGTIWVGCGRPFANGSHRPGDGGLNRLDKTTGKFIRYMHDPSNPASISSDEVRAIFEDAKGNFWIGTRGDGLQVLDRKTGLFTHYYYDKAHPEKLSRPPQAFENGESIDFISFITEDSFGSLLIGSWFSGLNYYNASEKKVTHHGNLYNDNESAIVSSGTATGLTDNRLWQSFTSTDGVIWIATMGGNIFNVKPRHAPIPYFTLNASLPAANALYSEPNGKALWIGTDQGLIRQDLINMTQKVWTHEPLNEHGLGNDSIASMKVDDHGKFWLATMNGLCRFDSRTNTFQTWRHEEKNPNSISSNRLNYIYIGSDKSIWIGTESSGVDRLNVKTGVFTHYQHDRKDSSTLSYNTIYGINEDHEKNVWIATDYGLNYLNVSTGNIDHYLSTVSVASVFTDASGVVWAATPNSLFRFDRVNNLFEPYTDPNLHEEIQKAINIIEDNERNLWISTEHSIVKVNNKRDEIKIYDKSNGVHPNDFAFSDNFIGLDGKIFLGDGSGYYAFFPNEVLDLEVVSGETKTLDAPIAEAKNIKLSYNQNNFSFEFAAISYTKPGEKKFLFKLENYDKNWHYIGTENKAYFYNIPPGEYVFRVKGVASDRTWGERTVSIILSPPWWRTWWAYALYVLIFLGATFMANRIIRNRIIEREQNKSREKELAQAKEIESAYRELKITQKQLIQQEKMASLGELTAGIAHEIQNPLNFVNNFSDLNKELVAEMNDEMEKGNIKEVKAIAKDIAANEEKINYHGKRADAIVKGMLQHSRSSNGKKEPTDVNALTDEYLRLAYHGLRAKDKSFNATMNTEFDSAIKNVNIIPQDIGRAILNLITNAFYAVSEKERLNMNGYKPTVTVSTRAIRDKVEIKVKDNGGGIPKKVLDKIFQPFFTTKPSGQGTGLGLSLSYDIIKAHGGDLKVETKEGEGAEFVIQLPTS